MLLWSICRFETRESLKLTNIVMTCVIIKNPAGFWVVLRNLVGRMSHPEAEENRRLRETNGRDQEHEVGITTPGLHAS